MGVTRYPGLNRVPDAATRQALKLVMDQVGALQTSAEAIGAVSKPLTAALDSGGQQLKKVADPSHATDAVNLQTLQKFVAAAIAQQAAATKAPVAAVIPGVPVKSKATGQPGPYPYYTNISDGQPGGVPAAPNLRWWRGDFDGISVPGLPAVPGGSAVDPAQVFTMFIDRYGASDQAKIFAAYAARGYTHFQLSWPDSRDGAGQSIAQFVATCQLVKANGFYPCIFLSAKGLDPADVPAIYTGLVPLIAALQAANCIPIACVGWELSIWLDPGQVQDLIDRLALLLVPATHLYVHFQEGYSSFQEPGNTTSAFWILNVGKLTGLLRQRNISQEFAGGAYQARIQDTLARFSGQFGYPADSGFGHPFDNVEFEYAASIRFNNGQAGGITEAEAQQLGKDAICTPPVGGVGVMGFGNGCIKV